MAEAQGLSSVVLQSPDIIGEQRQNQALKQQQALQQAEFERSMRPKPFDFKDEDELGQLPVEFATADAKMSETVRNYVLENANALSQGDPQKLRQLQGFMDKYNSIKKQADLAVKQYRKDAEELPPDQRDDFGFVGYNLDAEDFGQNLVIGDDLSISFQSPDGVSDASSVRVLNNPRSYYYKPVTWLDIVNKNAKSTVNTITGKSGTTITSEDRSQTKAVVDNIIDLNLSDGDSLASMILSYGNEVAGTTIPQPKMAEIINGGQIEINTPNGKKLIGVEDVKDWAKKTALDDVLNRTGRTVRERVGDDDGGTTISFDKTKGRGVIDKAVTGPKQEAVVFSPNSNVKMTTSIETKDGGTRLFEGRVKNIYKTPDGNYSVDWYDRQGSEVVSLNNANIAEIEDALKIPRGSFDSWYDFKRGESSGDVSLPAPPQEDVEEVEDVTETSTEVTTDEVGFDWD